MRLNAQCYITCTCPRTWAAKRSGEMSRRPGLGSRLDWVMGRVTVGVSTAVQRRPAGGVRHCKALRGMGRTQDSGASAQKDKERHPSARTGGQAWQRVLFGSCLGPCLGKLDLA